MLEHIHSRISRTEKDIVEKEEEKKMMKKEKKNNTSEMKNRVAGCASVDRPRWGLVDERLVGKLARRSEGAAAGAATVVAADRAAHSKWQRRSRYALWQEKNK